MKKLGLFFTLLCFFAFYALFIAVPPASAQTEPDCTKSLNNSCPQPQLLCQTFLSGYWCCPSVTKCTALSGNVIENVQPPAGAPAPGAATPTCDGGNGTPTALGCIPNEPAAAIAKILPWAIRLGTGLAFLLFLYGAFTLITAGSDPQKVDTGKSIITSAAAGLIFIILALALLRIIGVDILKL